MTKVRTGTVEQRGGKHFARVLDVAGVRVRVPLPEGLTADQRREMTKQIAERAKDQIAKVETRDTSWRAWARAWFAERERRKMPSAAADASRWQHWCRELHPLDVAEITRADIEALVSRLDAAIVDGRLAWKSAGNVWHLVKAMCGDMVATKTTALRVRTVDPSVGVRGPETGPSAARVYLYPNEMPRLLACAKVPASWRLTYALAAYSGLRSGELSALLWSDIDDGGIRVRRAIRRDTGEVKTPKGRTARNVPIEPALAPLLRAARRGPGDNVLLCKLGRQGHGVTIREHLAAAGITRAALTARGPCERPITLHDLRATFVTWMAIRGDAPQIIMQRAGHSSYATTLGYLREAESLGDVGVPFPAIPEALLVALAVRPTRQAHIRPKHEETSEEQGENMHASNMSNTGKELPFDVPGTIAAAAGEKAHDAARVAGLKKCAAAIVFAGAPFADLELWSLGATGTAGDS